MKKYISLFIFVFSSIAASHLHAYDTVKESQYLDVANKELKELKEVLAKASKFQNKSGRYRINYELLEKEIDRISKELKRFQSVSKREPNLSYLVEGDENNG